MIEYQGLQYRSFKCDFGRLLAEYFAVKLVDYGFHLECLYDSGGFDDVTWWLLEKK